MNLSECVPSDTSMNKHCSMEKVQVKQFIPMGKFLNLGKHLKGQTQI